MERITDATVLHHADELEGQLVLQVRERVWKYMDRESDPERDLPKEWRRLQRAWPTFKLTHGPPFLTEDCVANALKADKITERTYIDELKRLYDNANRLANARNNADDRDSTQGGSASDSELDEESGDLESSSSIAEDDSVSGWLLHV